MSHHSDHTADHTGVRSDSSDTPAMPQTGKNASAPSLGWAWLQWIYAVCACGVCFALAWWQWNRYHGAHGTYQNLGYALQWPIFGLFIIWGFRRFNQLRHHNSGYKARAKPEPKRVVQREIPPGILPPQPRVAAYSANDDQQLESYNHYLRGLDNACEVDNDEDDSHPC